MAQLRHGSGAQFQTQLLADDLTAGQDGDIPQHFLAAVAEAGSLDADTGKGAAQLIDDDGGKGFALDVLGDDDQLLAGLHDLLQQRQDLLDGGDLLIGDEDVGVIDDGLHLLGIGHHVGGDVTAVKLHSLHDLAVGLGGLALLQRDHAVGGNLLHRLGDQLTDGLIPGGNGGDTGDIIAAAYLLALLHNGGHGGIHRLLHSLLHDHGIGAGGHVLHALPHQCLRQQGRGGGTVTGCVVGLGGDLLHQLCAHVLEGVLQLDILGDGHAVIGDEGCAVFFIQHHIAALGSQCDLDGIRQLIDARLQCLAGLLAVCYLFCHKNASCLLCTRRARIMRVI